MIPLCDLHAEYLALKDPIDEAIARVISGSAYILGDEVAAFERVWKERCEAGYCVATSNCTDALKICLLASYHGKGHKVLVPAMTVTADAEAVLQAGCELVIGDVGEHGMLTLEEIERQHASRDLNAVIVVHLHGHLHPEIEAIASFCKARELTLIEDCAHAHGVPGAGSYGDFACWSFFPSKVLGAMGDAGAITGWQRGGTLHTENVLRATVNHGRLPGQKHEHDVPRGGNHRMDGLQAAILRAKVEGPYFAGGMKYSCFFHYCVQARRVRAANYNESFYRPHDPMGSYYVYTLEHDRRDALRAHLKARGIASGLHYPVPLDRQPVYRHLGFECPQAWRFAERTVSLPLSPFLLESDQVQIVEAVREFGL